MEPDIQRQKSLFRYAIIDLAAAPSLAPHVMGRLQADTMTLFARHLPAAVRSVGPWVVNIAKVARLEAAIDHLDCGQYWGYYVHSSIDIVSLRHTLRKLNLVNIPESERPVLFRYWDPRVMSVYLNVATKGQKRSLFEFIDKIDGTNPEFSVSCLD